MDAVQILVTLLIAILLLATKSVIDYSASEYDDDSIQVDKDMIDNLSMVQLVMFFGGQFMLSGCGIVGAIQFSKKLILCAIVGYVLGLSVALWYLHPIMIAVNLLCIYPHIIFVKEMDEHLMTPENYPNELSSCSCVRSGSQDLSTNEIV